MLAKSIKIYVLFFMLAAFFPSCKKTKLNGEYYVLSGTWAWTEGVDDGANTNFRLQLKLNGKYELCSGNKVLEKGRLLKKNGYLQFINNVFYSKKYLDTRNVYYFTVDSLIIKKVFFTDQPISYYKKIK